MAEEDNPFVEECARKSSIEAQENLCEGETEYRLGHLDKDETSFELCCLKRAQNVN